MPAPRPYARFSAFGELLLRLATRSGELLSDVNRLDLDIGGSEGNVAAALAALGHGCAMISLVPDTALGDTAVAAMRSRNVDCRSVVRAEGRMGLYWLEHGAGNRPSDVIYDREASAFANLDPAMFTWADLLRDADRLHLSGITVALGARATEAACAAAAAADAANVPISFDGNYRTKLWAARDAVDTASLVSLAESADILLGDFRDIGLLLGLAPLAGDTQAARRAAAEAAFKAFPRLKLIASTIRRTPHAGEHLLAARVDTPQRMHETDSMLIPAVVDRIGSGDAFAAGILHAHRLGLSEAEIAHQGLALAGLKHTVRGDVAAITERRLRAFLEGGMDVAR